MASQNTETLAVALNMSARSLHRQLQEEGASLQQLKDEVRFVKAKELLLRTSKPIKQVAEASGFQNEKSFISGVSNVERHVTGRFSRISLNSSYDGLNMAITRLLLGALLRGLFHRL
jgi:AraC-like DNA-binding protein